MSATRRMLAGWLLVAAAALGMVERTDAQGREPPRPEARGLLKSVDVKAGQITVEGSLGREPAVEKTYSLAKDVEVAIGNFGTRVGLFKEGKLADLPSGIVVSLSLSADQKTVVSILAEPPTVRGLLKSMDAAKKTLTISQPPQQREQPGEEVTYALAADAEITVDDGRGRRISIREGKLTDLAEGALVTVRLSFDKKQVQSIHAEGPSAQGTVKAIDVPKKTLTLLVRPPRGDDTGEEKSLTLADDVLVVLDDGRGRRLSLKEGKLANVPVGSMAMVKLSVDRAVVVSVRVEGPMIFGLFKAADPVKGTITIAIPKGRDDAEEKTLTLAKDARVLIDGSESKLANLKAVDNGPFCQLRLSLDQKTVQSVVARQQGR